MIALTLVLELEIDDLAASHVPIRDDPINVPLVRYTPLDAGAFRRVLDIGSHVLDRRFG